MSWFRLQSKPAELKFFRFMDAVTGKNVRIARLAWPELFLRVHGAIEDAHVVYKAIYESVCLMVCVDCSYCYPMNHAENGYLNMESFINLR